MFDTVDLVENERRRELEDLFDRLAIMDPHDPHWWWVTARTLHEEFDDDPRTILDREAFVAPKIASTVRSHRLPGSRTASRRRSGFGSSTSESIRCREYERSRCHSIQCS